MAITSGPPQLTAVHLSVHSSARAEVNYPRSKRDVRRDVAECNLIKVVGQPRKRLPDEGDRNANRVHVREHVISDQRPHRAVAHGRREPARFARARDVRFAYAVDERPHGTRRDQDAGHQRVAGNSAGKPAHREGTTSGNHSGDGICELRCGSQGLDLVGNVFAIGRRGEIAALKVDSDTTLARRSRSLR